MVMKSETYSHDCYEVLFLFSSLGVVELDRSMDRGDEGGNRERMVPQGHLLGTFSPPQDIDLV